jgi:precorrin-2 methylase
MTKQGSLLVVGTGFKAGGHLTAEAESAIKNADKVFYGETNSVIVYQIKSLNPNAEMLMDLYGKGKPRYTTYAEMAERIVTAVREGLDVCAVFYGHPGVFAYPSHESIRIARAEGFEAQMLPGISAEDCLFADLVQVTIKKVRKLSCDRKVYLGRKIGIWNFALCDSFQG